MEGGADSSHRPEDGCCFGGQSDGGQQVVELEHWPEVKFPLFQKPGARGQPARVWQESQLFWPLLARVAQPQLYRELVTLGRPADQKYELLRRR